jgi:hypothetical protein
VSVVLEFQKILLVFGVVGVGVGVGNGVVGIARNNYGS